MGRAASASFLIDTQCDPEIIDRIMVDEMKRGLCFHLSIPRNAFAYTPVLTHLPRKSLSQNSGKINNKRGVFLGDSSQRVYMLLHVDFCIAL